ncbi:MAG: nucleotidyltransferase family protein [Spirochaetales bacterium]|nr:nucleotidyltransferase family protein [Spirochaetales bacterium]
MNEFTAKLDFQALSEFCQQNHISRLAIFGSVARGDDTPESDLDVLVEFEPGKTPGFAFFGLSDDLEKIFHREVDLNTPGFLSMHFRAEVLEQARTLYQSCRGPHRAAGEMD